MLWSDGASSVVWKSTSHDSAGMTNSVKPVTDQMKSKVSMGSMTKWSAYLSLTPKFALKGGGALGGLHSTKVAFLPLTLHSQEFFS